MDQGNDWWAYVKRCTPTATTQRRIAAVSGVEESVISRWARAQNPPSAEKVIQFARGVGRPPAEALAVAGYLTDDEATQAAVAGPGVDQLPDDALLAEVARRMNANNAPALIRGDSIRGHWEQQLQDAQTRALDALGRLAATVDGLDHRQDAN